MEINRDIQLNKIGEVGIDSGNVIIIDPAMCDLIGYSAFPERITQVIYPSSLVVTTGDGDYPIYEVKINGEIVGIFIDTTETLIDDLKKAGNNGTI